MSFPLRCWETEKQKKTEQDNPQQVEKKMLLSMTRSKHGSRIRVASGSKSRQSPFEHLKNTNSPQIIGVKKGEPRRKRNTSIYHLCTCGLRNRLIS